MNFLNQNGERYQSVLKSNASSRAQTVAQGKIWSAKFWVLKLQLWVIGHFQVTVISYCLIGWKSLQWWDWDWWLMSNEIPTNQTSFFFFFFNSVALFSWKEENKCWILGKNCFRKILLNSVLSKLFSYIVSFWNSSFKYYVRSNFHNTSNLSFTWKLSLTILKFQKDAI